LIGHIAWITKQYTQLFSFNLVTHISSHYGEHNNKPKDFHHKNY